MPVESEATLLVVVLATVLSPVESEPMPLVLALMPVEREATLLSVVLATVLSPVESEPT